MTSCACRKEIWNRRSRSFSPKAGTWRPPPPLFKMGSSFVSLGLEHFPPAATAHEAVAKLGRPSGTWILLPTFPSAGSAGLVSVAPPGLRFWSCFPPTRTQSEFRNSLASRACKWKRSSPSGAKEEFSRTPQKATDLDKLVVRLTQVWRSGPEDLGFRDSQD